MIYPCAQFLVALIWGLITPPMPLLPTIAFIAASLILVVLSRRSFHRQTIALLFSLGMMSIQSLEFMMLALHVQVFRPPSGASLPIPASMSSYLTMLFQANLWFAGLGAAAAAFVAFHVYFGKPRLEMLGASPNAKLIENPTWLREAVLGLANRANVNCPEVCLVDSGTPQAFTVRAKGKYVIALSVGILECLDTKEVEACVAHEVAHIKNNDFAIRFLATLGKVALFLRPVSHLIEAAIYRTREFHADKTAALLIGGPDALVSLLTKLSESNLCSSIPTASGQVCARLFDRSGGIRRILDKHPALESRIRLLNELRSS